MSREPAGRKASKQFLEANYGTAVQQLILDGLRYRFLRECDLDTIRVGGVFAGKAPDNVVLNGEDLDRAVDLAMGLKSAEQCCGDSGDCSRAACPKGRA